MFQKLKTILAKKFNPFKEVKLWNGKGDYVLLAEARLLKKWKKEDHYTYHYKAYENFDGTVVLMKDKYFIRHEETEFYKYDSVEEFSKNWFPKPRELKIENVL